MKGVLGLDPRSKLALLLVSNVFLFMRLGPVLEVAFIGLVMVAYLTSGHLRAALRWLGIYLVLLGIDVFMVPIADRSPVLTVVAALASGIRIMVPCLITGAYAFTTTRPSEFAAALRRMRVPERWIIPVVVVIRYFPTLRHQCQDILDAMRLRGIGGTPVAMLRHPRASVEHILVPLLASAVSTAEDLSVACLTKGIENPGRHTCATSIELRPVDGAFVAAAVALLVARFLLGRI